MDPEAVTQIVKAITSLHDGRTWKPETFVSALAALAAAGAAIVTFILGKRQIASAQRIAQQQIDAARETAQKQIAAAHAAAQLQIESAQAVAKQQSESAQTVARQQLVMPMREEWIGKLREKLGALMGAYVDGYFGRYPFSPENIQRLTATQTEIGLMLNLEAPDHLALNSAIQLLHDAFTTKSPDGDFRQAVQRTVACSRTVLRSEWQRAKADG